MKRMMVSFFAYDVTQSGVEAFVLRFRRMTVMAGQGALAPSLEHYPKQFRTQNDPIIFYPCQLTTTGSIIAADNFKK